MEPFCHDSACISVLRKLFPEEENFDKVMFSLFTHDGKSYNLCWHKDTPARLQIFRFQGRKAILMTRLSESMRGAVTRHVRGIKLTK